MCIVAEFGIGSKPKVSLVDRLVISIIAPRYVGTNLIDEGDLSPFVLTPPFTSIFDESECELGDPELLRVILTLEFWRGQSDHCISLCVFLWLEDMNPDVGSVPEKVIDILRFGSCEPDDLTLDPADDELLSQNTLLSRSPLAPVHRMSSLIHDNLGVDAFLSIAMWVLIEYLLEINQTKGDIVNGEVFIYSPACLRLDCTFP